MSPLIVIHHHRLLRGPSASIYVGPELIEFTLSKRLLIYFSPVAANALATSYEETGENTMELIEHDPDAFFYLHRWLYTGKVGVLGHYLSPSSDSPSSKSPSPSSSAGMMLDGVEDSEGDDKNVFEDSDSDTETPTPLKKKKSISSGLPHACTTLCRLSYLVSTLNMPHHLQSLIISELRDACLRSREMNYPSPITPAKIQETWAFITTTNTATTGGNGKPGEEANGGDNGDGGILWCFLLEEMCAAFTAKPLPKFDDWKRCFADIQSFREVVAGRMADRIIA